MSEHQAVPGSSPATFLLTVRGQAIPATLEDTRTLHNQTAGVPQGVAAARSLGDLSHNVFAPISDELRGELLFLDLWNSLTGMGQFFGDPQVQYGAAQLFSRREATVWAHADAFTACTAATINSSRMHGIASHSVWTKVPNPGEEPASEVLGIDLWTDPEAMNRHYSLSLGFDHLGPVFAGPPQSSVWLAAPGDWVEW